MDEDRRREIGLFRYALARDAADPGLSKAQRGRLVRALVDREHLGPDGRLVRVARGTLDEWIRAYRRGGFEALVPKRRIVEPRTPHGGAGAGVRAQAGAAGADLRRRSGTSCSPPAGPLLGCGRCRRISPGRGSTSARTAARQGTVYGRFEASERNELWTGDGLHGPRLDGSAARAVLLVFIDDHSRLVVGWRWGTGEDVFRLEAALRSGVPPL
jgi:putative transposase